MAGSGRLQTYGLWGKRRNFRCRLAFRGRQEPMPICLPLIFEGTLLRATTQVHTHTHTHMGLWSGQDHKISKSSKSEHHTGPKPLSLNSLGTHTHTTHTHTVNATNRAQQKEA